MKEQTDYQRARQRVEELKSFYSHLVIYLLVNAGLFLLNMLTMPNYLWFFWSLLGWGIGLAIHAFWTFAGHRIFGRDWEERQIRKILEKEK